MTVGSRMSTAYIVSESLKSSFSSCWVSAESRWYCSARLCRPSIMLLSDRSSSTSVNASLMSRSTCRPLINNADSPADRPSADSKCYIVQTHTVMWKSLVRHSIQYYNNGCTQQYYEPENLSSHTDKKPMSAVHPITAWPCWKTVKNYMSTKFSVDSSSRFPFRALTHNQTKSLTQLTPIATLARSTPRYHQLLCKNGNWVT